MQARMELERTPLPSDTRESFADLLKDLAGQSATLVREEVSLARQELRESVQQLRSAMLLLAVGAISAACAVLTLLAALLLALSQYWQPWQVALAVGLGVLILAGVLLRSGLGQLRQARLKPEQTLATLEENKEWLKELT